MNSSIPFAPSLFLIVASFALVGAGEEEWSQFRGPGGRGIATGSKPLPVEFDADTNVVWRTPLAPGNSSPCVYGDRIFVTGHAENERETLCIDRVTGEVIWRNAITVDRDERFHQVNSPAAATPTTDGERVYVYFGAYGVLAYDFDGELAWEREMPFPNNTFGTAASPIIAGDYLILASDTNNGSVLDAIERETGETVWSVDRESFKSGWSTPTVWSHDGIDELLLLGVWWLSSYNLDDGTLRWSVPGLTDEPIVTPVAAEGLVFVTSYNMKTSTEAIGLPPFEDLLVELDVDGTGSLSRDEASKNESVLSRADADGEGDHPLSIFFGFLDEDKNGELTETEWGKLVGWLNGFEHANALVAVRPASDEEPASVAWQHSRGIPECPSPLYYDGRIYLAKNGGMVTCLDAGTGAVHFEGRSGARGPTYASPVAGDGKLYLASARGVITVLAAGDELKVLASNDLGERIMATPALVDGKVYVRTDDALYAFGSAE